MMMKNRKGLLILVGGNESKRRDMEILKYIVDSGESGAIVVIPTASDYPQSVGETYLHLFKNLGSREVTILDIRNREEANQQFALDTVERAAVIFFTGGDQVKLVKTLADTDLFQVVNKRLFEGATVAGTSAGAAAAGDITIYSGDDSGCTKNATRHTQGFGFLKGVTVDSHFYTRGRMPRLIQHIATGDNRRGIGISEDTAIVIQPDNTFQIIGSGLVMCLNGATIRSTNYDAIKSGERLSVDGITLACLSPGTRFDLDRWEVVSPAQIPAPDGIPFESEQERMRKRVNT